MPRKKSPPSYRFHKARNCAVVTINGRNRYLGPYGSPESKEEYAATVDAVRWDSQRKAIANNLRQILFIAKDYMKEHELDQVSYSHLVSEKTDVVRSRPTSAGEDYSSLIIKPETESLTITLKDGKSVTYPSPRK